ncbi:MAG: PAS domain S-box protein [Bacteroidales bacterium]|nr:PAS domain S-box protein [Bacteroidales bacterium]
MREPTTVFIVEDEMLIAACLKDQLLESGFKILGSSTRGDKSIEAIRKLKEEGREPDIVLMDINLRGELNGIDTARLITKQFQCAIIFLTGQSSREVYEQSFFIKPFGYVLKPYDVEQMVMTIEIAAYQRKLEIENKKIREKLEKLLTEKMKENEELLELYETIIDNTLIGIWVLQDEKVVFSNNTIATMFGYSPEEIKTFREQELLGLLHPDDQNRLLDLAGKRLEGDMPPQHTTFRIIRKDGKVRWMKAFFKRIQYQGKPALHQAYLDITEYVNFNPNTNHQTR